MVSEPDTPGAQNYESNPGNHITHGADGNGHDEQGNNHGGNGLGSGSVHVLGGWGGWGGWGRN